MANFPITYQGKEYRVTSWFSQHTNWRGTHYVWNFGIKGEDDSLFFGDFVQLIPLKKKMLPHIVVSMNRQRWTTANLGDDTYPAIPRDMNLRGLIGKSFLEDCRTESFWYKLLLPAKTFLNSLK